MRLLGPTGIVAPIFNRASRVMGQAIRQFRALIFPRPCPKHDTGQRMRLTDGYCKTILRPMRDWASPPTNPWFQNNGVFKTFAASVPISGAEVSSLHAGNEDYLKWRTSSFRHSSQSNPITQPVIFFTFDFTNMRFSSIFSVALFAVAQATPITDSNVERAAKPPAFLLAGDSTTAVNSCWGDGLLATLTNGSVGKNLAKSGATTASFVSDGVWANVLAAVKTSETTYTPYVTSSAQGEHRFLSPPLHAEPGTIRLIAFSTP